MFCNKPFLEGQMSKDKPTPLLVKKHIFFNKSQVLSSNHFCPKQE